MRKVAILLLLASLSMPQVSTACSFAITSFHQVRTLKGRVVGARLPWPLSSVRWIRQSKRPLAKLTLYDYRWPYTDLAELTKVAERTTDNQGYFDFGTVKEGHYILDIKMAEDWVDVYDVQVTNKAPQIRQITIDVSPIHPDCTGGHEFVIETMH